VRPNFLFILADDMGSADLGCYGCPDIKTPNLDALARRGVRFTRAYANAPECSPTRTALMTGRYQQRVGGLECAIGVGNVGRYDEAEWLASKGQLGLPATETSIARMLKTAGYDTACAGKWHLGYDARFSANAHGFDEYFGILGGNADYYKHTEEDGTNVLSHNGKPVQREGYLTDLIADHAIGWLKKRTAARPFFLYVPFNAPHTPLQAPGDGPVKDTAKWNEGTRETYAKMVEHMDRRIGDLLNQLESMEQAGDTMVVFMSDNGGFNRSRNTPLRAGKSTCWEGGIRVPCLASWRGRIPEGKTTEQVTLTMDMSATMIAAAGIKPRRPLDGIDLMPQITGETKPVKRTVFWSYKRAQTRRWAAREGDWKYVIDNGVEALHNLADDEREQRDLMAAEPVRARRLKDLLASWRRDTAAPRLAGFSNRPDAKKQ
jgi:N-acetylgalactosamine-6-sulfatase